MGEYSFSISHYLFSMKGERLFGFICDLPWFDQFSSFNGNAFLKILKNSYPFKQMGPKFSHLNGKSEKTML